MSFDHHERYVFLFGHPDDDVFISGTMRLLIDAGAEVHAAWLTSGDFFGQGKRREGEVANVTAILGLNGSHTHLLGFPDLGLVSRLDQAADRLAELLQRTKPTVILADAYEGGHPDHDSVNFLAYEASARAGIAPRLFEFPLYNAAGPLRYGRWKINSFPPGGPSVSFNPLNEHAIECKYRMMRAYSSQWAYMIPARLASPRSRLMRLGEPYRICPADRDHTQPPHPGKLSYERWFNSFMRTKFSDFQHAVQQCRTTPS
jgi:LmbE family N-acetylglucosaminyl deacetylase